MISKKSKIHQKSKISECAQKSKTFLTSRKFENSSQIKAILFDMDGVLIDSHDAWFYIFNKALKKFGNRKISRKEFDDVVWSKAFDQVAKKYFKAPIEEILKYYAEIYDDYARRLKLMGNVKKGLAGLKSKRIKMVVVSNTQRKVIEKLLNDIGLAKFFHFCLGGDDVSRGKPEPDILFKAIKKLKLKKNGVLFVGDTKWDRMAAEKAGIKFIGFRINGYKRIESLSELLKLV